MNHPEKGMLRAHIKALRNDMNPAQKALWDARLNEHVLNQTNLFANQAIMAFYPIKNEPDLRPAMASWLEKGIKVLLPVTPKSGPIYPAELRDLNDLDEGPFGTHHPKGALLYKGQIDLFLVPGLAFSPMGDRLGYGAGYYDVLLKNCPGIPAWGVAYPFQLLKHVPTEAHDVRLDRIWVP
jgi:5-formyltetrahydrofolate cyclo-ligase